MIEIIFWIIIIGVIVCNIKKKTQKNYGSSSFTYEQTGRDTGVYEQNIGMNGTNTGINQANTGRSPYNTGMNQSVTGSCQRTQNVRGTATKYASDNKGKSGGTAAGGSQKAREKETKEPSTLDYLNEKARQDQREHAIEKMEERKRASAKYGNRPVGGRYLLGDPIPQGMKIVCCAYCGAENVVKIGYRGDRDCYFCRTRLED